MSGPRARRVIAIDGPSGAGKTTVARAVAARLGVPYLETGAMYRALGLKVLEEGIDPEDRERVEALAAELDLRLERAEGGRVRILLDGRPVGDRIRTVAVSTATSQVSVYPAVRRRMVALQRRCAAEHGIVMEGRDIGTRVFPDTPYKFFLEATPDVRVERRLRQLREAGRAEPSRASLAEEVLSRDRRDSSRSESPLTRDGGYEIIDTSVLSPDEVVERIVERVSR